ncbi:porin [Aquabacterium sp. CECT 9606]|uniref:porin n=1 Tax=Aquabacterium sp. CECT 9606 TaxID=2845822 RepID=UPI001E43E29B|nr:porin [Aquabacterium sp. CECT 9606]CAH0350658.1 Outer membrane porin protein 32 [Aquabacterium sp. CECT 9606]
MNTLSRLSATAAASLLGLIGSAQAQSSVTIYGAIGLDVLSASKVYNPALGTTKSVAKIEDNAIVNSRIGVKGVEDLGGGLKAVFDLESTIHPDTGSSGNSSAFWNRGAYVGLAGDFGSIKLGHQWNVADDYMGNYFVFGFYSPFLMSGFGALSDYYDNAIKYNSPNWGGFEGGLYYSAGEKAGMKSAGQKVQGAATYTVGMFSIGLTAFSEKDPFGVYKGNTMYAGGLSYDFGVLKTRLGLASSEVNYLIPPPGTASTNVGAFKAKLFDVGLDVPITAAAAVSVDYVKKDVDKSADGTGYTRVRASYALSKRTSLNANLIFSRNMGNADFAFVTEGNGFAGLPGQKQTLVTAGITHSF